MKYTIKWIEVSTTKTGKEKADVSLEEDERRITIWGDFPNFKELKIGSAVSGDINTKVNGKYTNHTLYPERTDTLTKPTAPSWAGGKSGAGAGLNKKIESIEKSQDRKEDSIKKSSTFRDATLICTAMLNAYANGKIINPDDVKKDWEMWREWLDKRFDEELNPF